MACQFDRLSDCILLTLLEQLDSTSLYQLSQACTRFQQLALETSLWKKIDGRRPPNNKRKTEYILDRAHGSTDTLLLKGGRAYNRILELKLFDTFSKLTVLALENQTISQTPTGMRLAFFPKTLVELSFKNSAFDFSSEFFRKGFVAMENLKVLIMDGCTNVNSSIIMSVSKFPKLEIFSCYKCSIENSVAYFSIAVSHGFKKIKVLDVRLSGLGNTFLTAMIKRPNIIMIYFQNRDTSYELDFRTRAEEATSQKIPVPKGLFLTSRVSGNEENMITDFGTLEFSRTAADYDDRKLPKSVLYEYPYAPCTCGFKERQEALKTNKDEAVPTEPVTLKRGDERNLVEFLSQEDSSDDESPLDNEASNGDGYSEGGNGKGNFNTETGQSSDNKIVPKQKSSSSASGVNSHLNPQNQEEFLPSPECSEIIYRVFSKKKTKDQAVGTENPSETETLDSSSHEALPENVSNADILETDSQPIVQHREESVIASANDSADLPSTSGLATPLRKRKLSSVDDEGRKRTKTNDSNDGSSSSSDDEEDGKTKEDKSGKVEISSHPSSPDEEKVEEPDKKQSDEKFLYISRSGATTRRISEAVSSFLRTDRWRRQADSGDGSSNEPSTSRSRRRDVALVECREGGEAQPARTKVYPCACGNHSVIVVTADQTEEGDGPPLNPPENHFHPQLCEQRINLNDHQSLRVINRNENVNARPEIELIDINRDKSLKCGLRQISFRGYLRVTDLTLRNVGHLHLELLDVTYTKCTKSGILDFLRLNPNCRVLHKDFCVCKPRMDF